MQSELLNYFRNDHAGPGLLLAEAPTGYGKTYQTVQAIYAYLKEGGTRRVLFVTTLLKNLPTEDLRRAYSIPECYLAPSLYYEFEMPPISAVYFGASIDDSCKGQVAKKELQELCSRAGIPTFSMRLDEVGYAVHPIPE